MIFKKILPEIFFPRRCLACDTRGIKTAVCDVCLAAIPIHRTLFCGRCRARVPGDRKICHPDHPYILGAAGDYDHPTAKGLVHALKFERDKKAADDLATLLGRYTEKAGIDLTGTTIIPLPLSKHRFRERGFNQSELIAKKFAADFGLPVITNALTRTRHATPQSTTANAKERHKNVAGAFIADRTALIDPQTQKLPRRIILLDDVTTSGATLREAANALKLAGARNILALTCAMA